VLRSSTRVFTDETSQNLREAFIERYNLGADFKFDKLRKATGQTVAHVRQEIKANRFTGSTLLAAFLGVSLAWTNTCTNCQWRERSCSNRSCCCSTSR
jgi:hypothetical protein